MILDVNNTYIILRFKTSFSVQWLRLHVSNGHVWTVIHNDRKKSSFQDVVFLKCQTGASVHSVMFIVASLLCVICYSEWTLECGVWTPRCWRTLVMKQSGHPDADRHSWWNSLDTQMLTNTRDETFWTPRCWRTLMMKVWTPRCWQTLMMKQSGHPDADKHSWWNSLDTQMLTNTRDETFWTPRCWSTLMMKHSSTWIFCNLWLKLIQKLFRLFIKVQWIVSWYLFCFVFMWNKLWSSHRFHDGK